MKLVADASGRLACPQLFPPNSVFNAVAESNGSIRLDPVPLPDVPVVEPVRTAEGFLMLPVKLSRAEIAAAIRKDRDAQ